MSQPFKRALGPFDATMIAIGGMVDEVYAEAQYDDAPLPRPAATLGDVFVSTKIRIAFGGRPAMINEALARLDLALRDS